MTNNLNYSVFEPETDCTIESTTYDDIMKEVEEEDACSKMSRVRHAWSLSDLSTLWS